jgi:hypothetical protein
MKFNIENHTRFEFNKPIRYSIQQLRLTPQDGFGQHVSNWQIKVNGLSSAQIDTFGNTFHTLVMDTPHQEIFITTTGEVETELDWSEEDVTSKHDKLALPIYLRNTALTKVSDQITQFTYQYVSPNQTINKDLIMLLMSNY